MNDSVSIFDAELNQGDPIRIAQMSNCSGQNRVGKSSKRFKLPPITQGNIESGSSKLSK